jgi:uncharacterized protein (TIGR02271 family)
MSGADAEADEVRVRWEKAHVKDAPSVEADGQLSHEKEAHLYQHYGFDYSGAGVDSAADGSNGRATSGTGGNGTSSTTGRDTSGPTTDDAMTRSEEELQVGKTQQEHGRARLKKYVVTEQEQHTIPVQREVARVEREPITDANVDQALDGPDITDEEHEMTLSEERPVVDKQVVPKERVRLGKDVETNEHQVSEEVRKERIEAEGDLER